MPDLILRPGWTDQPIPGTEPSRDHVFDPVYVLRGADLNGWYKETKVPIKAATTRANIAGNQSGDAWHLHATNSAIDLGVTTQLSNSAFAAMFTITPVTLAAPSRLLSTKYNTGSNYNALELNVGTDGHPNVSIIGVGNIYDGTGGPTLVAGKTSTIVYTWTNAAGSRVFVDGRKHGAAGSQGYAFPAFTQVVCGRLAFDHNDTGDFLLHGMAWSNTAQSLPDEVLRDLSANPWALYEPDDIYLWGTAGGGITISAEGIASAEVFGMPGISVGEVTVSPPSINSLETFGSTTVATSISISPSGIPSLESFGTPAISVGSVVLSPSGIASQEAFGIASIDNGSGVQTLVPIGISSLEAFGLSTVNPGPITLSPGSISSLEAFGTAIISSGEIILSPSAIATAEAFGLSVVTVGTTTILPIGIGSEENFGIAVIEGGEIIAINIYPRRLYYNYLGRH